MKQNSHELIKQVAKFIVSAIFMHERVHEQTLLTDREQHKAKNKKKVLIHLNAESRNLSGLLLI